MLIFFVLESTRYLKSKMFSLAKLVAPAARSAVSIILKVFLYIEFIDFDIGNQVDDF